jgi:hypothetical protein
MAPAAGARIQPRLGKSSDLKGLYDWTWKVADGESVTGILP